MVPLRILSISVVATLLTNCNAQNEQSLTDMSSTITTWPKLQCPEGTNQVGNLNADIAGCGLEGCDQRYQDHYKTIQDCVVGCTENIECTSFTWAPLNGDQNHPGKTVCTLYDNNISNQQWSPQQIMCSLPETPQPTVTPTCPYGTDQIGTINADIAGCGIEGCDQRYQDHYQTIQDCKLGCDSYNKCLSFTWAPLNGDQNHAGKTVCTLYDSKEPNQQWVPQQIMCAPKPKLPADVTLHCDNIGTLEMSRDGGKTFTIVATEHDWTIAMHVVITEAGQDTVLRLTCEDQGVIGGFIATVRYDGINYSTTEPINEGYWKLISSDDGDISSLIYSSKGSDPWHINTEDIEEGAVWIWNEHTYNTMVFQFDFNDVTHNQRQVSSTDTTCGDSKYSVDLKWVLQIVFMLVVSVILNIYMCCTRQRKLKETYAFGHVHVKDCEEVEGKSTDIVSV